MKLWNRLNFARKLAVCLFCANLAATVIGIAVLYSSARTEALRMNTLLNEENLAITKSNIESLVTTAESSAISIFFEHDIKELVLGRDSRFDESPGSYNNLNTQLHRVLNTTPAIRTISIYKRNGSAISTHSSEGLPFEDHESFSAYACAHGLQLSGETSSSQWSASLLAGEATGYQSSFVNLRELKDVKSSEATAIMLVYLKENTVYEMYSFFGPESFMLDESGLVVSAGDKSLIGTTAADTEIGAAVLASGRQAGSFPYGRQGTQYVSSTYIPALGCYLVAVPSYDALTATQNAMRITAVLLVCFSLLVSFLLAQLISRGLTGKIRALKRVMQANELDFSARFSAKGSDEINYLGNSFNKLMDQIESYIQQINETQSRKRASDLQLLQSQINPHLLYNTLDSVLHSLSHNDLPTAQHTIELLSDYFKISLSRGQPFVPIRTELEHIERYIELQRICRGKLIVLSTQVEQGLLDTPILKTVFQPVVENAFLHAFIGSVEDGEVSITARQGPAGLTITIEDNGIGMSEKQLAVLRQRLQADRPGESYGLWNVNQRLTRHYGAGAGLVLESEFGEGTRVTITIPLAEG